MKQTVVGTFQMLDGTQYDMLQAGDEGGKTYKRNPPKPYRNRREQKTQKRAKRLAR